VHTDLAVYSVAQETDSSDRTVSQQKRPNSVIYSNLPFLLFCPSSETNSFVMVLRLSSCALEVVAHCQRGKEVIAHG
jgi:hypothetical protein